MHQPYKVNLGCGHRFCDGWVNIDIAAENASVIRADIKKGVPLPSGTAEVVYHSAVLEHLSRDDARRLMNECYRLLRSGGVVRVGVPDLEQICVAYLEALQMGIQGANRSEHDHEWMVIELCDQLAREESGGEMLQFVRRLPVPNGSYIYQRIGEEGRDLICEAERENRSRIQPQADGLGTALRQSIHSLSERLKFSILRALFGAEAQRALEVGRFRISGEAHRWMYDRFSLGRMLTAAGFRDAVVQSATRSSIPGWADYGLDVLKDGTVVKPDLLFMEATRP